MLGTTSRPRRGPSPLDNTATADLPPVPPPGFFSPCQASGEGPPPPARCPVGGAVAGAGVGGVEGAVAVGNRGDRGGAGALDQGWDSVQR